MSAGRKARVGGQASNSSIAQRSSSCVTDSGTLASSRDEALLRSWLWWFWISSQS